jgi:hypothetical protein
MKYALACYQLESYLPHMVHRTCKLAYERAINQ